MRTDHRNAALVALALCSQLLSGCGMHDSRHWVTSGGRVIDMTDGAPKPIADAWVRLTWSHLSFCPNPVQSCSQTVCDSVKVARTDSDGNYRVWGIPLLAFIRDVHTNVGSDDVAVYAPGYIAVSKLGTVEFKDTVIRTTTDEYGRPVQEIRTDTVPKIYPEFSQYSEVFKRWSQRNDPLASMNLGVSPNADTVITPSVFDATKDLKLKPPKGFWMVKDARSVEVRRRSFVGWGDAVCSLEQQRVDIPVLRQMIRDATNIGATREDTETPRAFVAERVIGYPWWTSDEEKKQKLKQVAENE